MSDIVNLNQFRKKKKYTEKQNKAEENRAKYGRSKAEKQKAWRNEDARKRHVDGHERDDDA